MSDSPEIKIKRFSRDKRIDTSPIQEEAPPVREEAPLLVNIPSDTQIDEIDDAFIQELQQIPLDEEPEETKKEEPSPRPSSPPPLPPRKSGGGGRSKKKQASEFGDLFDNEGTPILGKDKRELLTRIQEYKTLFPDELKNFKIKPNASVEQLQASLSECEVIVSCSAGLNKMLDEAILSTVSVLESISQRTDAWDVTGTALALRQNPEFKILCKRLYLKHRLFSDVPVEAQLGLLIVATMMTMRSVNGKRRMVSQMLSQDL